MCRRVSLEGSVHLLFCNWARSIASACMALPAACDRTVAEHLCRERIHSTPGFCSPAKQQVYGVRHPVNPVNCVEGKRATPPQPPTSTTCISRADLLLRLTRREMTDGKPIGPLFRQHEMSGNLAPSHSIHRGVSVNVPVRQLPSTSMHFQKKLQVIVICFACQPEPVDVRCSHGLASLGSRWLTRRPVPPST